MILDDNTNANIIFPMSETANNRNVKLVISYDGTDYHGWQTQADSDLPTIQSTLEKVVEDIVKHPVDLRASGRTDAGVHADGQVANFFTSSVIPSQKLAMVINSKIPYTSAGDQNIRVLSSETVDDDFDSNTSAISKLYRYTVYNSFQRLPNCQRFAYYLPPACDITLMQQAAKSILGEHDFRSLASSLCDKKNTVRTVLRCDVWREYDYIYFDVEGTGFLHNMVRNIVGLLIDIGRERRPVNCIPEILAAQKRSASGNRAPANGLTLRWVRY